MLYCFDFLFSVLFLVEEVGEGEQLNVLLEITDAITETSQTCTAFVIWTVVLCGEQGAGAR